ncbi:Arylmalonate decarboxylase [Sulfitobacter noctilucicola]|uniref:Arylmalonate decarboxylase n=1 Tax=Sulfitobacter noctilucicola TaxID=1342301 RepID=A0A7W6Q4E4_9RHOB|nr:aspartate/glutamate racemase family protein [Sulfitobacter noctilucicola]KIN64254.1 Arylmalonate decarboxylase [Sulfitobacter noctilucicola]MBB4174578.1 arylmalonate decarboxylase [Sulfitobacter noctilucicola]
MACVGLIVPPAAGEVPPEPPQLYPDVTFIAEGMALPQLTPEGYDSVIGHTAALAKRLKECGAEAVSLMGTSLSFYRGPEGNAQVRDAMAEASGLPVTTMTDSVLEALATLNASRVAVATAYEEPVNRALMAYFEQAGIETVTLKALHLRQIEDIFAVTADDLITLGRSAMEEAEGAEALFISCGGLRTLPVIRPLEDEFNLPVVTSATAGAWGARRLLGHSGKAAGFGRLFGD